MKTKLLKTAVKFRNDFNFLFPSMLSMMVMGTMLLGNIAFAGDGQELFKTIVKALGGISIAGAAIIAVFGAIAYAEAKSEGEGPAMSKAKNQIQAAVMLAIVGVALTAGATSIAGLVKDITL